MSEKLTRKQQSLRQAGLLHAEPQRVQDPLFLEQPAFFDPYDQLRAHLVDRQNVVGICQRYGISRQTFYTFKERFLNDGTAGLLAKKPGPKGPSKLTANVRQFIEHQIEHDPQLSTRSLLSQLKQQFDLSFHKRTLEKLLQELRSKKKA
jgi:transposase